MIHLEGRRFLPASCSTVCNEFAVLLAGKVSMSRKAIAQLIGKVCSSMDCSLQHSITVILNWLLAAP